MPIITQSTTRLLSVLVSMFMVVTVALAEPAVPQQGIAEFARCSRQCVAENTQCREKLEKKCTSTDSNCFEACDVAYPACMAKCPRPGSSAGP